MNHRRADVRAAVLQRQRSQGHLRAVTVSVGAAGVVTAGVVAAILPGSTHAAASSGHGQDRARQQRILRQHPGQQRVQPGGDARQHDRRRRQGHPASPSPSPPPAGEFSGDRQYRRPGRPRPGAGADHRAATGRVRRLLTRRCCPAGACPRPAQPAGSGSGWPPVPWPASPGPASRES